MEIERKLSAAGFDSDVGHDEQRPRPDCAGDAQRHERPKECPQHPAVLAHAAYKRSGYKGYLLKQAEFEQTHNTPYAAHCYALLNDEPRAIAALETAYNRHLGGLLFVRTAPEMDSIRSSPGFLDLVRRIGFPPSPSDKN